MDIPTERIDSDPLENDANLPENLAKEIAQNECSIITVRGLAYPSEAIRMADMLLDCLG
ncbi:hypothetical protein SAMN04487996_101252 [Dyadobacter soli]|uniref:Uncharacterized protein n=1 Tax=Dyadobacter soli TaxID=659014 RepID=A0A1G6VIH2_9BACT|nr:hypothetical protein [Dyadobacter soli]SDD53301.1 hypothetical protein SAMN04487996_101252 [Dyadobacter soli]